MAFAHGESDTFALITYIASTYLAAKLEEAVQYLEAAFKVPAEALDVAVRVKVRSLCSGLFLRLCVTDGACTGGDRLFSALFAWVTFLLTPQPPVSCVSCMPRVLPFFPTAMPVISSSPPPPSPC